jgi:hypothetical protein
LGLLIGIGWLNIADTNKHSVGDVKTIDTIILIFGVGHIRMTDIKDGLPI